MKNSFQIFLWAAMHSEEFRQCYWMFPIEFETYWGIGRGGSMLTIRIHFRSGFRFYIPMSVQEEYWIDLEPCVYDAIPF